MKTSFVIREATKADAHDMAVVFVRSWQSAYRGIVPDDYLASLSIKKRAERIINDFDEHERKLFYYVAEKDDEIIGCIVLSECRNEDKSNAGEVLAIYLFEEYWDKGYGRKMMEHAINVFRRIGYEETVVWVLEENLKARRFYEKLGFTFDGTKTELEKGKVLSVIRYTMSIR